MFFKYHSTKKMYDNVEFDEYHYWLIKESLSTLLNKLHNKQ